MKANQRLKIAVQKSGRLNSDSLDLLSKCGLKIKPSKNSLLCHVENFNIDILFVRDDDIPTLVIKGICDLGIVGENVLSEQTITNDSRNDIDVIKKLGFSKCRLSIAVPENKIFTSTASLSGLRIATSYPNILSAYLKRHGVGAEIMMISGSVEIAPRLEMADAICDLVSTGRTLEENNLIEVQPIMQSQAVLVKTQKTLTEEKNLSISLLLNRIESVLMAQESKYILFHAPKSALGMIKEILPGCETPTIMPLKGIKGKVAVHVVSSEGAFWGTLEKLKKIGASSILVLPIDKMMN